MAQLNNPSDAEFKNFWNNGGDRKYGDLQFVKAVKLKEFSETKAFS